MKSKIEKFLVDNWRNAWRWFSVRLALLGVAIDILSQHVYEIREFVGENWARYVYIAIIVARLISQNPDKRADRNNDRDDGYMDVDAGSIPERRIAGRYHNPDDGA